MCVCACVSVVRAGLPRAGGPGGLLASTTGTADSAWESSERGGEAAIAAPVTHYCQNAAAYLSIRNLLQVKLRFALPLPPASYCRRRPRVGSARSALLGVLTGLVKEQRSRRER